MSDATHHATAPEDRIPFLLKVVYGFGAFVNNTLAAAIGGMMIVLNLGIQVWAVDRVFRFFQRREFDAADAGTTASDAVDGDVVSVSGTIIRVGDAAAANAAWNRKSTDGMSPSVAVVVMKPSTPKLALLNQPLKSPG